MIELPRLFASGPALILSCFPSLKLDLSVPYCPQSSLPHGDGCVHQATSDGILGSACPACSMSRLQFLEITGIGQKRRRVCIAQIYYSESRPTCQLQFRKRQNYFVAGRRGIIFWS